MEKVSIFDVADYYLSKGSMTHKKLQKLCYYTKAWALALYDEDIMPDYQFEAWVHGPVNPELYEKYKGYGRKEIEEKPSNKTFSADLVGLMEDVWYAYADLSGDALEALTHSEAPWKNARHGLKTEESGWKAISNKDMHDFYLEQYHHEQGE